ncbi:GntR family transcriptional regulator [Evansella cellulosilytica]|uniref:Transcriptional regulator, GntR family n=1 Tax=Evansella cellulosilytica (strain ATCC 21833 / DSM 2522 / FERM P-1141 / JCM 9156 / N-4) TaxID=649639 RepID=E6TT30_EVAC2|nr:GntR family transcriptional regulator [Evansella cellulosilytica]ADU31938.1 transcriptional regulator, GntR family [Evansella cellulosilytica DSM 2522]
MLDKNSPLPIYYQLEEEIRELINSGQLKAGDLLPSERVYAEKYEISRMTVRQAITNLVSEGLLIRQKGKGTFVAEKKLEQPLKGITSFSEEMEARNMKPSTKIISFQQELAEPVVAKKLQIEANTPVYKIHRIRLANDIPLAVETTYTPAKFIEGISEEQFTSSFYDIIEKRLNLSIGYGEQEIESVLANDSEIKHLNLHKGDPVLLVRRVTFLSNNEPFEYCRTTYRADKYKYKIQMHR